MEAEFARRKSYPLLLFRAQMQCNGCAKVSASQPRGEAWTNTVTGRQASTVNRCTKRLQQSVSQVGARLTIAIHLYRNRGVRRCAVLSHNVPTCALGH